MVQNVALYDVKYCIDDLCILELVKYLLRHLVNPVHISSVALSPWIRKITSIGPQIVISTFS